MRDSSILASSREVTFWPPRAVEDTSLGLSNRERGLNYLVDYII